jgi:hypothetical protein
MGRCLRYVYLTRVEAGALRHIVDLFMDFWIAWVEDTIECCDDMELKGRNMRKMNVEQVTSPFRVMPFYSDLKSA